MANDNTFTYTEWKTLVHSSETGELIWESPEHKNLEVNSGRNRLITMAFVPSASTSFGGFYYLGVGASATAAQVTDTQLTYELIGNGTRKVLTNTAGLTPTNSDVVLETITIGSTTFFEKIVLQAIFTSGDGNNGNTFNEYALFNTAALPGTPTASSGVMFNHYIDPNPVTKTALNQVTTQITIRY